MTELAFHRRPTNFLELIRSAKKRGLCPPEQTYSVIRVLNKLNTQITSRYLTTGHYRDIRDDVLDRAARDLDHTVGTALSHFGFSVRI